MLTATSMDDDITVPYPIRPPTFWAQIGSPPISVILIGLLVCLMFVTMFLFLIMSTVDSLSHRIHIGLIPSFLAKVLACAIRVVA